MNKFGAGLVALLSVLYILNPTAGLFEILPDNLPFIGNIDEATAGALLLASLKYLNEQRKIPKLKDKQ